MTIYPPLVCCFDPIVSPGMTAGARAAKVVGGAEVAAGGLRWMGAEVDLVDMPRSVVVVAPSSWIDRSES